MVRRERGRGRMIIRCELRGGNCQCINIYDTHLLCISQRPFRDTPLLERIDGIKSQGTQKSNVNKGV